MLLKFELIVRVLLLVTSNSSEFIVYLKPAIGSVSLGPCFLFFLRSPTLWFVNIKRSNLSP